MKVLAMPARDDMSSLLRIQWPAEELRRQGANVEITTDTWLIQEQERSVVNVDAPDCDVIVLCRPKHRAIAESIPLFQEAGIAVVVDYDDDLTAVHGANVAAPAFDPVHNEESNWQWALECCRQADMVTVSTPALLDVYAKHGRGVVIPNRLPSWRIPRRPNHQGPTRLGWAGYIGTHPTDLTVMDGAVDRVLRGRMRPFQVIGPGDRVIQHQLGGCAVRATGRIEGDAWLPTIAAMLDVGIAPAERSAFNLGKSCLKSIEGSACGVAMIASPTPDNRRAAADGLCVLADGRREWERTLRLFLDNDDARGEQVERGREGLQRHLLEDHVDDWWSSWAAGAANHAATRSARSYLVAP